MISPEVLAAFGGGETDREEFKESPNADLREAVCAFANDMGNSASSALIFVGVQKNGTRAGLTIDDDLLARMAQIRTQLDVPAASMKPLGYVVAQHSFRANRP
jgi:predicted HTH transcriptional regulator